MALLSACEVFIFIFLSSSGRVKIQLTLTTLSHLCLANGVTPDTGLTFQVFTALPEHRWLGAMPPR